MTVTFFAVRPMFSAVDRALVNKIAFLDGLVVSYVSRKLNPFRSSHFYNVFAITTKLNRYEALHAFAASHSFLLLSVLFGDRVVLLDFARSVHAFSMLGFYPMGVFRLSIRLLLSPLVSLFSVSFLNIKLTHGYYKSIN